MGYLWCTAAALLVALASTSPGYLRVNSMPTCDQDGRRAVTLCVGTLHEKHKCDGLAAVARVYSLQPAINCTYETRCLVSVANKSSDVTIITTDKLLPAIRDYRLQPLFVHLPKQLKKAKTISAIVKSSSEIKSLSDLQGKKACFSTVDGMGWTSFAMYLYERNNIICPYTKAISKFFSEICVSSNGLSTAAAQYYNINVCPSENNFDKWYDQGGFDDIYHDNEALAFHCLATGKGDVAFISKDSIPKYLKELKNNHDTAGLSANNFRAVCESNPSNTDCHLRWASYSQVLVNKKITPSQKEDIIALFTGLNNLFGHYNSPSTRTFSMFAPSNTLFDTLDSIELMGTPQFLEQTDEFLKKTEFIPKNYERDIASMIKCSPSSASLVDGPFITLILPLITFFYCCYYK